MESIFNAAAYFFVPVVCGSSYIVHHYVKLNMAMKPLHAGLAKLSQTVVWLWTGHSLFFVVCDIAFDCSAILTCFQEVALKTTLCVFFLSGVNSG